MEGKTSRLEANTPRRDFLPADLAADWVLWVSDGRNLTDGTNFPRPVQPSRGSWSIGKVPP